MDAQRLLRLRERLQRRAVEPVPPQLVPLLIAAQPCGWVDPAALPCLLQPPTHFALAAGELRLDESDAPAPADGDAAVDLRSRQLRAAALRLRDAGLVRHWRNELLDVRPRPAAPALARIERAACRLLGITTYAVHVNGFTPDGRLIVCRRAADKSVDPGLWDNLAAGMIASGETEIEALAREAQEEAGLQVAGLPLVRGAAIRVRRAVHEGHMSEIVQVYDIRVPADAQLRNQDGEVQAIEVRAIDDVLQAIERGEFTLEASLATIDALLRRQQLPSPA